MTSPQRAGFAALIGAPNAGKSTLTNALVGSKVSIVTRKVQTTRFPVRGVAMSGAAQIVLVDTPGIFTPRRRLDRAMVQSAWGGADDADAVVHLVDAQAELAGLEGHAKGADRLSIEDTRTINTRLVSSGKPATLALNKIDGMHRERLLEITRLLFDLGGYGEVFMISASSGAGVEDLKAYLAEKMPEGPWLYPEDVAADLPARLLAAEITREKVYLRVHQELPYSASVDTTAYEERRDGSIRIEQTILVERDGQRAIVIGDNGQTLKWIGTQSRVELAEILDRKVHLFLHVKVKENWADDREMYRNLGLDFDV